MIEQQYYTRERGGLFGESDGYDSIAKSKGLKLDFIKKYIHPLCSYDMPGSLKSEEPIKEEDRPSNFIIAQTPTGEMIVGQAVYKSKDFTGLRPTFFMHNYVAGDKDKERLITNPERLFGIKDFAQSYERELGKELPSLIEIPYEDSEGLFYDRGKLFQLLGITEKLFKQMLHAVFIAAVSKKKVYICLNVSSGALTTYAKALLCHIYQTMPRIITQDLGVSTYSKTLEAKKGIHILFVEKETIKYGDGKIDKEFVFDFTTQKFLNTDHQSVELNKYFDFALKYANNQPVWEAFNALIIRLTKAIDLSGGKILELHHYLALIFDMKLHMLAKKGYSFQYREHRKGLLVNLANYIKLPIDERTKEELKEIMNYVICELAYEIDKDILLEQDEIKEIIKFEMAEEAYQDRIDLLTYNLAQGARLKKDSYIKATLDIILPDKKVYFQLFKRLYSKNDLRYAICYKRLEDYFKEVTLLDQFIQAMNKLEPVEELFQEDGYYKELISRCFNEVMENTGDKIQLLKRVQKWCKTKDQAVYPMLLTTCEAYVLEHINLKTISQQQLLEMTFTQGKGFNYAVIEAYKGLQADQVPIERLEPKVLEEVQGLIKLHYSRRVRKEDFYRVLSAFIYLKPEDNKACLDMQNLLKFLSRSGMAIVLDFIIWAKGQHQYIDPLMYDEEIVRYFLRMKDSKKKVPMVLIKAKLEKDMKTQKLYRKIKVSQQSQVAKFLRKNKYGVLFGALVLTVGLVFVGLYYRDQIPEEESFQHMGEELKEEKEEVNETPLIISPVTPSKLDSEVEKQRKGTSKQ